MDHGIAERRRLHRATGSTVARLGAALLALIMMIAMAGCSGVFPADPDGTLDRVSGGTLRVGATPNGEFVSEDDGVFAGSDVELVEGFAELISAEIAWTLGNEETLVGMLERGDLDLVVGGLSDASPWSNKVGMTRAYNGGPGGEYTLVMLVPMGENRFLSTLEAYLDEVVAS